MVMAEMSSARLVHLLVPSIEKDLLFVNDMSTDYEADPRTE